MNLSVSTWNYLCAYSDNANLTRAINEIKTDGFGLELWLKWKPDLEVFERGKWSVHKGLTDGLHAISLHTSLSGEKKEYDFDDLRKEIDFGSFLGAEILVVHADTLNITDRGENKVSYKQIKEMVRYARRSGVTLALENTGTMNILRKLVNSCGIKVCLDIGHANYDSKNSPIDFLDEFADEVVHFHFSDNDGSSDQHLVPGAGNIVWSQILNRIKELNFTGQCILELNTDNARQSAHQAKEYLRNKWEAIGAF